MKPCCMTSAVLLSALSLVLSASVQPVLADILPPNFIIKSKQEAPKVEQPSTGEGQPLPDRVIYSRAPKTNACQVFESRGGQWIRNGEPVDDDSKCPPRENRLPPDAPQNQ